MDPPQKNDHEHSPVEKEEGEKEENMETSINNKWRYHE